MQRRVALLEAAARIFGHKPFDEASMTEVASAAGVCIQALYEHFPSKRDLYEQVMVFRAEIFQERAASSLAGTSQAPLDRLRALAQVYIEQFLERPFLLPMYARDRIQFDFGFDSRFRNRFKEVYQTERHRLCLILREAVESGALRPQDPEFLAQLTLDVLQASLYYNRLNSPAESATVCVNRALDCLFQGVVAHPNP